MSDQQVREIQLGGKQLVFLFMASVVVAVAIFLLGVSVGRGVRTASVEAASSTDVAVADAPSAPLEMPPATETKPEDLRYHDQLQGTTPPPAGTLAVGEATSAAPATPPSAPAQQPPPAPAPVKPSATSAATETTPPAVAAPKTTSPAAAAPKPAPSGGVFLQTDAFRSRDNADRRAAQLKSKGYAAFVEGGGGALFRVRIGPFADRAEATRVADRLRKEEGITPSIQP